MPAQTPDTGTRMDLVTGSIRQVVAQFASVTANDTWKSGLALITNAQATSGTTAALVTTSGGTLTFASTSTGVQVSVVGY